MSCAVKTNDTISEFFAVDYGVRQGCILSTLLFNIFINDIIVHLMYADNLAILAENDHSLQDLLHGIGKWWQMNHLEINEAMLSILEKDHL